ncbi:NADH dehydrogenase subunit [Halococcoides cellulosivorans]|uniref:NADH dehydrogenase subunit n=1 Tax=Halococcoides cellulosivorans TaxID=1679096 RepID=A0A2R4WYL8_9EURY|nr:NADH dehydrogenase subunit [Halococcoides cellulosivorans]AWB26639.1 NADH dehydrogenase subunit [Halococcoides cellulosivorans]
MPDRFDLANVVDRIRNAGIAGAGGAGFPSYAKWERLDEVEALLVNHQESEPDFIKDRWLGVEHADRLAALFEALLDPLDTIVIGTKAKYGDEWIDPLRKATGAPVHAPEDLPLDDPEGVVIATTPDRYEFGMESVLLREISGTVIGRDLPMDHGWIVQNTETMVNVGRALAEGRPVTHKYVHVDGDTPRHRFLRVPVGTPVRDLLGAAGRPSGIGSTELLADGGPGWSFEISDPDAFGVTKRTNALLVLDRGLADEHTIGQGRINVLGPREWRARQLERDPAGIDPDEVRVPLLSNTAYEGLVNRGDPIVRPGDEVQVGDRIADPGGDIGLPHHASIDGRVTAVTESHVTIER